MITPANPATSGPDPSTPERVRHRLLRGPDAHPFCVPA